MIDANENKEQMTWYMEMIGAYSNELLDHCKRTAELSLQLSCEFPVDEEKMYQAALIHDLGKIMLPKEILYKKEPLTKEEKMFIDMHSVLGYQMVKKDNVDVQICQMILYHHGEKFRFYKNLEQVNDATMLAAEIIRVADAFDALTSVRTYRNAVSAKEAMHIMKKDKIFNMEVLASLKKQWLEKASLYKNK